MVLVCFNTRVLEEKAFEQKKKKRQHWIGLIILNSYSFPVSLHSASVLEKRALPNPSVRA